MTVSPSKIDALVDYCDRNLGDPHPWTTPEGYPKSMALCNGDSLYSTGSHDSSVVNVVNRYKAAHGFDDGARALPLRSLAEVGHGRGR
ncbi:hypothetical protein [Leekyejoonella antrihumi]|uniref:hypothetical protein n=1 Tax=Leekyejoonella antrihumi TaxID=1660198 RepID=UPI001C950500|nr:hypothetical protein [Leekyejoonella antrihumi]